MMLGDARIYKHLDGILVNGRDLQDALRIKQWVGYWGDSNHFLVIIEVILGGEKPHFPFKFNDI